MQVGGADSDLGSVRLSRAQASCAYVRHEVDEGRKRVRHTTYDRLTKPAKVPSSQSSLVYTADQGTKAGIVGERRLGDTRDTSYAGAPTRICI